MCGVIDWYGVSDLTAMAHHTAGIDPPGQSREDLWLGASVLAVPELARQASPIAHVHADAPPFFIAHGMNDTDVPPAQSEAFAEALRGVGANVELQLVPGAGHFWKGLDDQSALFDEALDFATRVTQRS